ncbi:MAG: hypothetical protein NC311_12560 [Muribaculaceae bacterium]|nr:hypothetical protein [Muribaculaceae bacterium]MCM1439679.1 hypothetical protein [Roseburia sp.]
MSRPSSRSRERVDPSPTKPKPKTKTARPGGYEGRKENTMTRIEKETVIAALRCYADQQERAAQRHMKKGEAGKAAHAQAQKGIAEAVMSTFAEILPAPSGTVKI